MAKKSLAVAALKAESVQQFIGAKLVEAGEALGTYTVSSEIDKVATVKLVDESLRAAMKAGLQRDMLKAGSQCYLSFTGAISAVREANELEPISNGTRDNYMSRIRDFISARGAEPLDLYGNIAEAKRKISETEQNFKSKVRTDLNDTSAKLNSLTETSVGLSDKVKQATLKSPVNGKISRLFANTVGGVIQPGKEVLEVVPSDDALVLETRIQPKDIAFVRLLQQATVKLTAYDYTIYGGLDAIVENISPDSVVDEKGNAYYVVKVRTIKSSLGKDKPIIPGMVAQVDIITGKKTVLSYLLKPVLKAKSYAFTER